MDFSRNDFFWIFIALSVIFLIVHIVSSIIIYNSVSELPNQIKEDAEKIDRLVGELDSRLNQLDNINQRVSSIESTMITLTGKYPPNQTINVNNMNQNELNHAINNAINAEFENIKWKVDLNFVLNIFFGSLISISFIVYLFGRKK